MDNSPIKALLVEDNPGEAYLIQQMLMEARGAAMELEFADRLSVGLDRLAKGSFDVVLLDLSLPDSQGSDTFTRLRARASQVPVVILTGLDDESLAVNMLREGAQDYLVKDRISGDLMLRAILYAIQRQEIDLIRSEIISILSSELRDPLSSINIALNLVADGETGKLPEEAMRMVRTACKYGEYMLSLFDDMLDIKKIEFGRIEFHPQPVDLMPLLEQAVEANRSYAEQLGIQFALEDPLSNASINADGDYLMQAFDNILLNAIRSSPPNSKVAISISPYQASGKSVIKTVEHRGIRPRDNDMPEAADFMRVSVTRHHPDTHEESDDSFLPEFASDSSAGARPMSGTGLSLNVARAIVEGMGGRMEVEMGADGKACRRVLIDLAMGAVNARVFNVLLVEDNPGDARLIREMLIEAPGVSLDLDLAHRISAGLERLAMGRFDVVILDLFLPDSRGIDTFIKLHAQVPEMPIIILSGLNDESLAIEAVRRGAQDYLVKGQIDSALLARSLRHAMERKEIDRMKGELICMVSHGFREPLISILRSLDMAISSEAGEVISIPLLSYEFRSYLTSVLRSLDMATGSKSAGLPEQTRRMISIAYKNSERLLSLFNDILDVEKIESGKVEFHLQPHELTPLVEQAIEARRAYAEQLKVKLILKNSLPGARVNVDSTWLMHALLSLLSKAAEYSPSNDRVVISITRRDRTEPAATFLRVAITDRGQDMWEETRNSIFQRPVPPTSSGISGKERVGLGLNIVKTIIERMGGQIGSDVEADSGNTFYFDLPEYHQVSVRL